MFSKLVKRVKRVKRVALLCFVFSRGIVALFLLLWTAFPSALALKSSGKEIILSFGQYYYAVCGQQ